MSASDRVRHRGRIAHRLVPAALFRRIFVHGLDGGVPDTGLVCRPAQTFEERLAAFRIQHDAYVGRGIAGPSRSGLRVTDHSLLPGTTIFVAIRQGEVVGTISLIEDGPSGLPMESTHPDEVAAQRATGRRTAEVGTLAVTPEGRGRQVSLQLYNAMYRWAARHRGIDDLVIAVHPRMAKFFRSVLMFTSLGPIRSYTELGAALSTPMKLDMDLVDTRYRAAYAGRTIALAGHRTDLYRFFVADPTSPGIEITAASDDPSGRTPNPDWSPLDRSRLADLLDPRTPAIPVQAGALESAGAPVGTTR